MSNSLGDLNNILFEQARRLSNENLKGKDLEEEMDRAKAINGVAEKIIKNGSLVLSAKRVIDDRMDADLKLPKMLEG